MRFGMFIHWGLYAIPARGEWVMSNEKMSVSQYKKYFDEFNPTDFDAKCWASVCRQAGMKYAVLTAKHHDGFCLFDSKLTEYKSTNTRFGRDIVREFLEAFRAEGIAVGLYFSLLDWSHPDFPKYADRHHPMRGREEYCGEQIDFDNYLNFMHGQVKELVTGYGKLDLLWFDFSYDDMAGEKWRASDLISMVRKYQPNVCIDNRLEGSGEKYGSIATASPLPYSGDFVSPEQIIPPHGIFDERGERIPWELCATLNDHWGYCESDKNYKSAALVIKKLVECVSKGGNMILNVGPDARGKRRLKCFGKSAHGFRKTDAAFTTADTAKLKNPNGEGIRSRLKCGRMNNSERFLRMFSNRPSVRCRFSGYGLMRLSRCGLRQRAASFAAGRHGIRCCIGKHRL